MAKFFTFICISLLFSTSLYADGGEKGSDWIAQPTEPTAPSVPAVQEIAPNQASDSSFDKRLPPTLPGEIMNDSGRKMKVWSSSGSVPVAGEPEPWQKGRNDSLTVGSGSNGSIGVIVDQRNKKHGQR